MIILNVIKNQGFTPSLEDTFLEQTQGSQVDRLSSSLTLLVLTIITVLFHDYGNGKVCDVIKIVLLYIIPLILHFYFSLLLLVSYLQNIFLSFSPCVLLYFHVFTNLFYQSSATILLHRLCRNKNREQR